MSIFDESQVLRGKPGNAGQFAGRINTDPETSLSQPIPVASRNISAVCTEAGCDGVMPGIYGVIRDRHEDDATIELALSEMTAAEVNDHYDDFVGPAVDQIEQRLSRCLESGIYSDAEVETYVKTVCGEAGYAGVMPGIYEVVWDRHRGEPRFAQALMHLWPTDVNSDYDSFVGPAVDELEDQLRQDQCSECGAPLADGEGYDGLCGSCADAAESDGKWSGQ